MTNLHQNLTDVLPILSEASICKETLLVSYYDTEKNKHISIKLGRLLTKKTSLSEKEVKALVELQRRNLKGELLMSLTQEAAEIVAFYKIHVAPIGGSSSCMKGEDCVRVYSYDENLFLATFYDGELADEEFYVGRTLVRKDTMEYIRTYATEQAYHDNIILTLERAGYSEGDLIGIRLAKEKTGNGWVMPYLDYYGKYVEEHTNYFEVVDYDTNLRADSTNGVMTEGVTCCNCGCVMDEDEIHYADEGDLCEACFSDRYIYFEYENYLRADCTRVYGGAYAGDLVPDELLADLDYHEVDSRHGCFYIGLLVTTDSGLQHQDDCVKLEEVTAEGNSYALEEDCEELTSEELRTCPYFTTGWYLSNRYNEILEEIDTWVTLESVEQLDLINIFGGSSMNIDILCYLLRKVRYIGTEEATFFELGFHKEQAYYHNGRFMFGYHKVIGTSNTMFTCHLDTVENSRVGTSKDIYLDTATNYIFANKQVLGADDGAGVALLCHMIENKVPGHYFFFAGEECGGVGSNYLASNFETLFPSLKLDRAIAFDRKGTSDVIVSQFGGTCCSDEFALALCSALGTDYQFANGSFTDTANLVDVIPECTNVSVGYYNEHSRDEFLDLGYLLKLSEKVLTIDWEALPTKRSCEPEFVFEEHVMTIEEEYWYELDRRLDFMF